MLYRCSTGPIRSRLLMAATRRNAATPAPPGWKVHLAERVSEALFRNPRITAPVLLARYRHERVIDRTVTDAVFADVFRRARLRGRRLAARRTAKGSALAGNAGHEIGPSATRAPRDPQRAERNPVVGSSSAAGKPPPKARRIRVRPRAALPGTTARAALNGAAAEAPKLRVDRVRNALRRVAVIVASAQSRVEVVQAVAEIDEVVAELLAGRGGGAAAASIREQAR